MPQYKLIYFNARGQGELCRLLFAAAGVEYEDFRFEREQWDKELKKTTPFGQAPVLEINGSVQICQSKSIARYLARQFGFAGEDAIQEAQVDMVCECLAETFPPLVAFFRESDADKKKVLKEKYQDETLPEFMSKYEELLKKNGGGGGYFVGDKMSVADIAFANMTEWFPVMNVANDLGKYPKLKALNDKVRANPGIAKWLEKRPKTER